jgi:hypothetical protein
VAVYIAPTVRTFSAFTPRNISFATVIADMALGQPV